MPLSTFASNLTSATSTGEVSYTGVGFKPKALLFFTHGGTATGATTHFRLGAGMAVSSTQRYAWGMCDQDAQSTSNSISDSQDAAILCLDNTGTRLIQADLVSMDSDGFTLDWTTVAGSGRKCGYMALGGNDLTDAAVVKHTVPGSTGASSVTGVGFVPECIITMGISNTSHPATASAQGRLMTGWATSSSAYGGLGVSTEDNQGTSDTDRHQQTDEVITQSWGGAVLYEASLTSFDSDGFTLNYGAVTGSGGENLFTLCLKGGEFKAGSFQQKTSTGTKAVTGTGFTPTGIILASMCNTPHTSIRGNARYALGFSSGTSNEVSTWQGSTDAAGTTACDRAFKDDKALTMFTEGAQTLDAEADFTSFDANGFTLNWTTATSARSFEEGNNEFVSTNDLAALSHGDFDFSYSAWIYLNTAASEYMEIFVKWVGTGDNREHTLYTSDKFTWDISTDGGSTPSIKRVIDGTTLSTGQWYHVYLEHDAASNHIGISVDNNTMTTTANTGGVHDGTAPFKFSTSGSTFDGRLAMIGFWKRLLTTAERTEMYNSGAGVEYSELTAAHRTSLTAYWNLDETVGNAIDSHVGDGSLDLSDNNSVTAATGPGAGGREILYLAFGSDLGGAGRGSDMCLMGVGE